MSSSLDSSKQVAADSGRVRSSRACLSCSRRKVKCDGLQPCNNCSKDSSACEYGAQKKRGPPKGCDPKGGRKKKATDPSSNSKTSPPTNTSAQKVSTASTAADPASRTLFPAARSFDVAERSSQQYAATHSLSRPEASRPPHTPPDREAYLTSQSSAVASSLSAKASFDARFASDDRPAPAPAPPTSYPPCDPHSSWSRPSYEPPSASIPPYSRRSPHRVAATPATSASQAHHYLQPQHPAHQHQHQHHPDHSWASSSSAGRHSQPQTASTTRPYDAYPLQAPSRDYPRASPLASHRSMPPPPPHTSLAEAATHSSQSASRSNAPATAASTYPSPRSNPSRALHDSPAAHHQSGASVYDRASTLPSTASLTRRHPVSASRLAETSTTPAPSAAQWGSATSQHSAGIDSSPAFTSVSHGYSPSNAALPHRPWYTGSQPPSPLGPASGPRSQVSSPSTHWHDHHVRYSPAAADHHSHPSSSKLHLEDRLPAHIIQRLLDIYITFVHPHWPIIYLPSIASLHSLRHTRPVVFEAILAVASNTFDAYVDSASQDDQQSSIPVLETLYAESPQSTEPAYKSNELRDHFLQRVKARIFEGKFTQDIGTIQAAILVSVIELGSGHTSSAFQFGGIACRMALDMNLHRCTAHSSSTSSAFAHHRDSARHDDVSDKSSNGRAEPHCSAAQLQERLRVFWACYIVDKILSTALDKPAQLRSAEIEADWPSVQEADEYDLWLNETTRKFVDKSQLPYLEGVKVHALSSFKAWAEVMTILERILEEVYSPQAKRDRHRTKGASDYEALLRLNDRLAKWRADLPPHLKWSGTWTSPELLSSASTRRSTAERKECDPHRGFPPQILTMRSWYCICLILLHRPRVPKLINSARARSTSSADENGPVGADDQKDLISKKGQKIDPHAAAAAAYDKSPELAGLDICNAAAKEVCDILHVYGSSFRIRKISSSWVYLIFQTATIHAALAASKSVVVFKARQSSIWSRRGSNAPPSDGVPLADEADLQAAGGGDPEAHRVTEAELEGSSELVKSSALYLAECVRYLKRIGPTWQSASHHVAVLRNLCIASAQARPLSPSVPHAMANGKDRHSSEANNNNSSSSSSSSSTNNNYATAVKFEDHAADSDLQRMPDSATGHAHQHHGDQYAKAAQQHEGSTALDTGATNNAQQQLQPSCRNGHHNSSRGAAVSMAGIMPTTSSDLGLGAPHSLQTTYLPPPNYTTAIPHDQLLAAPGIPVDHHHHQQQQQQQQHLMQQTMYAINANDSAFWASMPVASEGYNEWDEFFKMFNPGAGTDFASQQVNYHPTAALDLITALQDPNRLLSSLQHQQ